MQLSFLWFLLISLHFLPSLLLPTFFSSLSVFSTFHLPSLCLSLPLKRPTFFPSKTSPLLLYSHVTLCLCFFSLVLSTSFLPPYICYFVFSFVCCVHLSMFFLRPLSVTSVSISQCLFSLVSVFPPSSCRPFIIPLCCFSSFSLLC